MRGLVAMVTVMTMTVVAVVMAAGRCSTAQRLVQIRFRKIVRRLSRHAGVDADAALREQIQRAPAHATRDDELDALLLQPARQNSWLMRRRNHRGLTGDLFRRWIGFNQGELVAMAEVVGQAPGRQGNGNFHNEGRDVSEEWLVLFPVLGVNSRGKTMSLVQQGSQTERNRNTAISAPSARLTTVPNAIMM